MGTNGVILINLENRNAAEFESILVPGSYEKALGAATAGTYVTVYKWLYNGFAMTASLCTVEDKTEYISLVDKTHGGELKVYDDDTITLVGAVAPEPPEPPDPPTPVLKNFKAYHITSGSTTSPYSLMLQRGHFVGTEFSTDWDPEDMILDGEPIEITQSMCSGVNTPYLLEGCATIAYVGGWIVRAPEFAHEWMVNSYWVYYWPDTLLHQWENTADGINKYFCEDGGTTIPDAHLINLLITENGEYDASDYNADGFAKVTVEVEGSMYSEDVQRYIDTISTVPMYNGAYEYAGYLYNTQLATDLHLTLLADASQGANSVQLSESIASFSGIILQGVYRETRNSVYNTSLLYLSPITLNQQYWAGMKDRNSSYTCYVTFTSNTEAALSGNREVIIYGIP